jgi:hypothetical protein
VLDTRIRRATYGAGVIRRFTVKTKRDRPKPPRITKVETAEDIKVFAEAIRDGEFDENEIVLTFKNAMGEAQAGDDEERKQRLRTFAVEAWTTANAAYLEFAKKELPPLVTPGGAKKAIKVTTREPAPSDLGEGMGPQFAKDVARMCDVLTTANPSLKFDQDRVAKQLHWFISKGPRDTQSKTKAPEIGHSEYAAFPTEVFDGLERLAHRGIDAARIHAALFEKLDDTYKTFNASTAGSMRGTVAEIRDALRPGQETRIQTMRGGGYQPYGLQDTVLGTESVPAQQLKDQQGEWTAKPEARSGVPLELAELKADVDRVDVLPSGDEFWVEVKFDVVTATNKHSDPAQIDRLCATVRHADRISPLKVGRRIPAVSIVSNKDVDKLLFVSTACQNYVRFGVHLFIAGVHLSPVDVRQGWDKAAPARVHGTERPVMSSDLVPPGRDDDPSIASTAHKAALAKDFKGCFGVLYDERAMTIGDLSLLAGCVQSLMEAASEQRECIKFVDVLRLRRGPLPKSLLYCLGAGIALCEAPALPPLQDLAGLFARADFSVVLVGAVLNLADSVEGNELIAHFEKAVGKRPELDAAAGGALELRDEGVKERGKEKKKRTTKIPKKTPSF